MDEVRLRIGEVARRTGLTVRTLHHYDQLGLLVPSGRSEGDYRLYSDADLRRLLSIQHLKGLGLSLADVGAALDDPAFDAQGALDRHIAAVDARLAAEQELRGRLVRLSDAATAGWADVVAAIALSEQLRHPDASRRIGAVLRSPSTSPLTLLVDALLAEGDPGVRESLTWAIARHGSAATPLLVARLANPDAEQRVCVLHALSKVRDAGATGAVAELLSDAEPAVAAKAAFTLGQQGGAGALAALLAALGRGDLGRRDAVASAVVTFGVQAVAPLVGLLAHEDDDVRVAAADALGMLAEPTSVEGLSSALRDPRPDVREAALFALAQVGGAAARAVIGQVAAAGDPAQRALASRLLHQPRRGGPTPA